MTRSFLSIFFITMPLFFGLATYAAGADQSPTWHDAAKIFQSRCVICHQGAAAPKSLHLDTFEGVRSGSEDGPVVIPGKPAESELIRRVRGQSLPRMPLTGPPWLSDEEIKLLEDWIAAGLPAAPASPAAEQPPEPEAKVVGAAQDTPTWSEVAPLFLSRCAKCHSENGLMGPAPEGFLATGYAEVLASGERARVIPGNPAGSEVVRRIKGLSRPRMPFDGPPYLEEEEIQLIVNWIDAGAPDDLGNRAPIPVGQRVRYRGTLTGTWEIDGLKVKADGGTRIKKAPRVGERAEIRGTVEANGSIRATRIRSR